MMSEPVEFLLVEDNQDDIILIEEAFAEAKLMNVIFKVRGGEEALVYLWQAEHYKHVRRETRTRPFGN